ncbi:MAG: hypothetical protein NVV83_04605 [Afipia sp.]|nr:hypothetical protein [Afipia sp.]
MNEELRPNPTARFESHMRDSSLREKALECLFLGDLLRRLWCQGITDVEVLKPGVDRDGYDLVLESNGVVRHVQLKSRFRGSRVAQVDVHIKLLTKPGGCVIWYEFDPDQMVIDKYYWFGDDAGRPLPALGDRISRHSRGNQSGYKSERPHQRVVTKGRFKVLQTMDELITALFGGRPNPSCSLMTAALLADLA